MTAFARYPSLAGHTAVVTGGATGIGEGFVRALAANDVKVGFFDIQAGAAEALADEIAASGAPKPYFVKCDLSDTAALKSAVAEIHAGLGPASVLLANAADDKRQKFEEVTEADLDQMLAVNFRQAYFVCQAVTPQMRSLKGGSIVIMTSPAYISGAHNLAPYAAAKGALVGLTTALARELGPDGIRVNAIAPGLVHTPKQTKWRSAERAAEIVQAQCIRRPIMPDDVARLMLFLAAEDSSPMTKQVIFMDAGK